MRTLRAIMDEGNPNKMADAARSLPMGRALSLVPRTYRGAVAGHILTLPESAKARVLLAAYSVAGTLTGELTPLQRGTAVATTEAAPNASGNILFAAADAVTEAEVVYLAYEGEEVEDLLVVSGDVGTLLNGRAAAVLLEVTSLAGTLTGALTPTTRGATPTTGLAAIQDDPHAIEFAAADAVTSATVRYIAQPGEGDSADTVGEELDAEDKAF